MLSDKMRAGNADATVSQLGSNTWLVKAPQPITSIMDIESKIASEIGNYGYLRYTIKTQTGDKTITVAFKKRGTKISQSAFSLNNSPLTFTSDTKTILSYGNDDHDTLFMDADGNGVISRGNTTKWSGSFDKFRGASELIQSSSISAVMMYSPNAFIEGNYATPISFPKTSSILWLRNDGYYRVNNFPSYPTPSPLSNYINGVSNNNNIITISDGVNSFLIWKVGMVTACIVTVDLSTGMIYSMTEVTFSASFSNATEEDAVLGDQLFSIDGSPAYHSGGSFWYTPLSDVTNLWRDVTTLSASNSFSIGASTQSGQDVMSSIDSNGYVWFADWGHDDGGIFGVGNDSGLGTRQTNIFLVPDTFVA